APPAPAILIPSLGGSDMRLGLTVPGFGTLALLGLMGSTVYAATPTYSMDVAPIIYEKCAECHRPGSMAPMSLMTFDEARPWARAVKQKVSKREMPPWGA